MNTSPMLIAFAGLPGVGKTTIARALSVKLGAVFLRIDSIETALARSTLRIRPAEDAGYAVAYALAADNLRAGLSVVADSVNPLAITRRAWAATAAAAGARLLNVEVICSDAAEHRRRVETRAPDLEGQSLPDWGAVVARRVEPWDAPPLRIDAARLSVGDAVELIARRALDAARGG